MAEEDNGKGKGKRDEGKNGSHGLEGGSAKGECIEPREIPSGVIFFSKSTSSTM